MSLFICSKCGCIDNTAVSGYWFKKKDAPALCSECDPAFGKWHKLFKKQKATQSEIDSVENGLIRRNYVKRKDSEV